MGAGTEQATKTLAAANALLAKATEAHEAELARIQKAQADLGSNDDAILATDPDDDKALSKLHAQRVSLNVALEVLQRARLPKAEVVLADAQDARDAAAKEVRRAQLEQLELDVAADAAEVRAILDKAFPACAQVVTRLREKASAAIPLEEEFKPGLGNRCWARAVWADVNPVDPGGFIELIARLYRGLLWGEHLARGEQRLREGQERAERARLEQEAAAANFART